MIHDLLSIPVPVLEKVIRSVAVYLFLVFALRVAGKREVAQLNPFDFVVLLLLSNTVQNAIIGPDNSLAGGLLGAVVLLVANRLVVRTTYGRPRLTRLVQGSPTILVENGKLREQEMRKELITDEELMAAVRTQGVHDLRATDLVALEPNGALTVEPHDHLGEILKRLRRIEAKLDAGAR
ncbi:MAG TPA: YetF domain-containing protein [Actinomycetes bacterium]|nr:YetF domain-containing protein [Actinomycetes bacterium]